MCLQSQSKLSGSLTRISVFVVAVNCGRLCAAGILSVVSKSLEPDVAAQILTYVINVCAVHWLVCVCECDLTLKKRSGVQLILVHLILEVSVTKSDFLSCEEHFSSHHTVFGLGLLGEEQSL